MKSITKSLFKSLGVCFAITAMTSCGGDSTEATLENSNEQSGESAGRSSDEAVVDTPVVETVEVEEITAGSSEDWDSVLDEYDTYCTKLASLAKKAKAGDMTAIADYASALESAQALNEKLESATGTMTAAQAARFSKIAAKMASAMM